jgi:hypothetical protein
VADLGQSIGGLRHKRFNSNHGGYGPLREGGGSGRGAGGPRASVRRLGRSPLLRGVSAVFVFRYATGRRFSAAEARLTARLVNIAPALAAPHLGVNPLHVLVYTQYVLSLILPVVMAATVQWSWHMVGTAGRAAALAGTVFVTAMDLYSFVAG